MPNIQDIPQTYHSIVKQWADSILKKEPSGLNWVLSNKKDILSHIDTVTNNNTKSAHLTTLIKIFWLFDVIDENVIKLRKNLNKLIHDNKKDGDDIPQNFVTHATLLRKLKQLRTKFKKNASNKNTNLKMILLGLYVLIPALRNNFNNMKIINKLSQETNKTQNYLLIDGSKFTIIINNDKVMKHYGRGIIPIKSRVLKNVIKDSLKAFPRDYVITSTLDNKKPVSKSTTNNIMRSLFTDKNMTVKIFRSSYITWFYDNEGKDTRTTFRQREQLASSMRHSKETADKWYDLILTKAQKKEFEPRIKRDLKKPKLGRPKTGFNKKEYQKINAKRFNKNYYEKNKAKLKKKRLEIKK